MFRLPIAWKIFLAFCVVLLVVLGLCLWSLSATQRLHALNQALLTRGLPAARLEITLAEQVLSLRRYETRAVLLEDRAYQDLHQDEARLFAGRLDALGALLRDDTGEPVLAPVRARLTEYLEQVTREWGALDRGQTDEARAVVEGAARQASERLEAAVRALRSRNEARLEQEVRQAGELERWAGGATAASLGVSLLVGLGVAGMVAVGIARPIVALREATRLVAAGQYALPLARPRRDELGDLDRAFREMAQQIQELDALKRQLFANITHDLRSPLASIGMAASLLRTAPLSNKQERWLGIIQSDSEKLLRLTNQILDLSRLQAGCLPLTLRPVVLGRVVESAVRELRPIADAQGVELHAAVPDPAPTVMGDEDRLQQVLANLLSNAIKFTPGGGQVEVSLVALPDEVTLTVRDTGIGIPADDLPHVFDRYHQAHAGYGGTGLGLAIVKGLVEAHGGRVWAESVEGQGTRFVVALPPAARVPGAGP